MSTSSSTTQATKVCPDCGTALNVTIKGFRPATDGELARLTPETIRLLGMCLNRTCPGRAALRRQRSA